MYVCATNGRVSFDVLESKDVSAVRGSVTVRGHCAGCMFTGESFISIATASKISIRNVKMTACCFIEFSKRNTVSVYDAFSRVYTQRLYLLKLLEKVAVAGFSGST